MTHDAPPTRRWWRPRLYSAILAIVLVYAAVVTLYALSGQVRVVQDGQAQDTDVVLTLEPRSVNALTGEIELTITTRAPSAGESGPLVFDEDTVLYTIGARGDAQHPLAKDEPIAPVTQHFAADGAVELWPFDGYDTGLLSIFPARTVDGELTALDTHYEVRGSVSGWAVNVSVIPARDVRTELSEAELADMPDYVVVTAQRSVATIAFAVVLVALMVVVPVLVLMIAISAYRGRRKVEATLMSWMGAMLFATIPLRNFFPGSPPIGSWVDYLVVLWVIAGLIVGLAIFAAAWMKWTPRPDVPPRF